jgi:hypothetical protein
MKVASTREPFATSKTALPAPNGCASMPKREMGGQVYVDAEKVRKGDRVL